MQNKASRPSPSLPAKNGSSLTTQRNVAKIGMSAAMAAVVWTAVKRGRTLKRYHTLAGVALLAFTVWHVTLYKAPSKTYRE